MVQQLKVVRDQVRQELDAVKAGSSTKGLLENCGEVDPAIYLPREPQCLCGHPDCRLLETSKAAIGWEYGGGVVHQNSQVGPAFDGAKSSLLPSLIESPPGITASQFAALIAVVQKQQEQLARVTRVFEAIQPFPWSRPPGPRVLCHRCRRPGHLARNCRTHVTPRPSHPAGSGRVFAASNSQVVVPPTCQGQSQQPRQPHRRNERWDRGKLFVGGLSPGTDEEKLTSVFGQYGVLKEVYVIRDRDTGCSRSFGFVKYANTAFAKDAMDAMNGQSLDGRPIRVEEVRRSGRRRGGGQSWFGPCPCRGGGQYDSGRSRYEWRCGGRPATSKRDSVRKQFLPAEPHPPKTSLAPTFLVPGAPLRSQDSSWEVKRALTDTPTFSDRARGNPVELLPPNFTVQAA